MQDIEWNPPFLALVGEADSNSDLQVTCPIELGPDECDCCYSKQLWLSQY